MKMLLIILNFVYIQYTIFSPEKLYSPYLSLVR